MYKYIQYNYVVNQQFLQEIIYAKFKRDQYDINEIKGYKKDLKYYFSFTSKAI